ncbi:MAG: AzlD domain-containing protein [Actinomycetota bacterium]|nr:AzlD domain-containing protein [Actinomycetota bacterium]
MTVWLLLLGAAAVTLGIRTWAVVALRFRSSLPAGLEDALRPVAPAALAALVANTLLLDGDGVRPLGSWHLASAAAVAVVLWTRSAGWALLAGMSTLWAWTLAAHALG